ncbi:MAG TPA: ATP-dependent DNA ligase, partial [archaeon]|nr:ATP-dependent DNA ligase [archaeon]
KPAEAKYVIRTVLGQLRTGVAEGVVRDAIVAAFLPKEEGAAEAVEWAWYLRPDYGEVAAIAKREGLAGLRKAKLEFGKPYQVLLSEKSPSLEEALAAFERPVLEWKYDGMRCIMQKQGSRVWLFTRRLENITAQFPDIVELVQRSLKDSIVEGEVLALRNGKPLPFQELSQRIKRKHGIAAMAAAIPVQVNVFDATLLAGEQLFERTLAERRALLERALKPIPGKFQLSEQLATTDLKKAKAFYAAALAANQEGVMVKNLDSLYLPGRRAGFWLKVKPVMESLDLAIIGGTWGTGKRTGWLGSFLLGCRTPEGFAACGMIGTGVKEKAPAKPRPDGRDEESVTFAELTKLLKPHITEGRGSSVTIKPKVIIEVAYEEIQKSPTYESGFALRFPRVLRVRSDRGPHDADDLERIKRLFTSQKGKR